MKWALGISVGPGQDRVGASRSLEPGVAGQTAYLGSFPSLDQAVSAAREGAPRVDPMIIALTYPSYWGAAEVGKCLEELSRAGLDTAQVLARSDIEVFNAVTARPVVIVDATTGKMSGPGKRSGDFDREELERVVGAAPEETVVILTGDVEHNPDYLQVTKHHQPLSVERAGFASVAVDALQNEQRQLAISPAGGLPRARLIAMVGVLSLGLLGLAITFLRGF